MEKKIRNLIFLEDVFPHQFSSPTHRRENYLHHTKKTDPQKIHLIHFLSLI